MKYKQESRSWSHESVESGFDDTVWRCSNSANERRKSQGTQNETQSFVSGNMSEKKERKNQVLLSKIT